MIHNVTKPELRRVKELFSETVEAECFQEANRRGETLQSNGTEEEHGQAVTGWESDG